LSTRAKHLPPLEQALLLTRDYSIDQGVKLGMEKRTILFGLFVSDEEKKFMLKNFILINIEEANATMLVPGKLFHPSIIFAS
jgi:hypothetical protein